MSPLEAQCASWPVMAAMAMAMAVVAVAAFFSVVVKPLVYVARAMSGGTYACTVGLEGRHLEVNFALSLATAQHHPRDKFALRQRLPAMMETPGPYAGRQVHLHLETLGIFALDVRMR